MPRDDRPHVHSNTAKWRPLREAAMEGSDPSAIRSIAVHVEDLVDALETRERDRAQSVLRITPPFSGRMRARLHVAGSEEYEPGTEGAPLHVNPERLVADPPAFPTPDDTEDELRFDPERTYTPDRHLEYHERRVEEWRDAIAGAVRERTTIDGPGGEHEVRVTTLGEREE